MAKEQSSACGFIPDTGFITADELASRLKLQHVPNLKAELSDLGVQHVSINGKRIYRCSSLTKLFLEGNEDG